VRVLSIVHGSEARTELFAPVVRAPGHELYEWSLAWGSPPPRPLDDFGAVMVFGGAMHADQDEQHPWLRDETMVLQQLLDRHVPTLGVCLGAQLIARAAHAPVFRAPEPEIGWYEIDVASDASDDPVLGGLPQRFDAFQWHYYSFGVPAGAIELARSARCTQAFRLGELVWGVQFHPEVTEDQVRGWLSSEQLPAGFERASIEAETAEKMQGWNELGRTLCAAFLDAAERIDDSVAA
jgi:GMP synthase (glutamine-hydrolysing)